MGFFERTSISEGKMSTRSFKFCLVIATLAINLLIASCGNENDMNINWFIGYVNIKDYAQEGNVVEYELSLEDNTNARSADFCKLADNLFNNGACKGKAWDECGFDWGQRDDHFYFENVDYKESVDLHCAQKGLFDGCSGGSSSFDAQIRLCDDDISCQVTKSNEILLDLRKVGLSKNCTKIFAYNPTNDKCALDSVLILYSDNNLERCDPFDESKVCIYGKCTAHVCIENGSLEPGEKCDPQGQQMFNISGKVISGNNIKCQDFGLYPASEGGKPRCDENCLYNLSECGPPNTVLCGNGILEYEEEVRYNERCDLNSDKESYIHPDGTRKVKQYIFSTPSYCAKKEGYIGDASDLGCISCTEIDYEECPTAQLAEKEEKNCGDSLNEDYWYDLYVPEGKDRTKYITDNYLDGHGYFNNYKFDTNKCFNETVCHDCYDIDCDNKKTYSYKICNFKRERMCNDGFDNDGDGLVDGEDSEDCKFERYNPDLSLKGLCNNEKLCYDENYYTCFEDSGTFTKDNKIFICSNGLWLNEIKLISGLSYAELQDRSSLLIYCNDPLDSTNRKSYVIEPNSKVEGTDLSVEKFLSEKIGLYGKFCAVKSGEDYLVGTVLKNKNEINNAVLLFYPDPQICNEVISTDKLHRCGNTQMFFNNKTGILLKTNLFSSDKVELFNGIDNINNKIEELKTCAGPYLGSTSLKDLEKSGDIEAFALKKNNSKEVLGIIAKVNSTGYAVVYIKNLPSFSNVCELMNKRSTLKILDTVIKCRQELGSNNFVIAWRIPTEEALVDSKDKFDKLIKEIKI